MAQPKGWDASRASGEWSAARYLNGLLRDASRDELMHIYSKHCHEMDFMCLGSLWNKLGRYLQKEKWVQKFVDEHADAFGALATQTLGALDACNAQALSNIAHGVAKCGKVPSATAIIEAACLCARSRLGEFNPMNLAHMVWSIATTLRHAPALLDEISAAIFARLDEALPRDLAIVAWGYGRARHLAPKLFDGIAEASLRQLPSFTGREHADLVWGFAEAGAHAPALFSAVAEEVLPLLRTLYTDDLAKLLWGYALADSVVTELFAAAARASPTMHDFEPAAIATLLASYVVAAQPAPDLFDSAAEAGDRVYPTRSQPHQQTTLYHHAQRSYSLPRHSASTAVRHDP